MEVWDPRPSYSLRCLQCCLLEMRHERARIELQRDRESIKQYLPKSHPVILVGAPGQTLVSLLQESRQASGYLIVVVGGRGVADR
jgi:hypothetical protein